MMVDRVIPTRSEIKRARIPLRSEVKRAQAKWTIHHADALEALRAMPTASVDAIVTDPPSGIGFMNAAWDKDKGGRDAWVAWLAAIFTEARRVAKPGAHALVWALPRTSHWTATGLEDAGWELRDRVAHIFGTGFPKSLCVSKAMDKAAGASPKVWAAWLRARREAEGVTREDLAASVGCTVSSVRDWEEGRARLSGGAIEYVMPSSAYREKLSERFGYPEDARTVSGEAQARTGDGSVMGLGHAGTLRDGGHSALSRKWAGWGTALKPAVEDWHLARAPLSEGTVAANVARWGCGALAIDACRVAADEGRPLIEKTGETWAGSSMDACGSRNAGTTTQGRWPAHLILSHEDGCRPLGTAKVKAAPTWGRWRYASSFTGAAASAVHHADGDGTETVERWECVEGCAVAMLDAQSGERTTNPGTYRQEASGGMYSPPRLAGTQVSAAGRADASRFFFCAKPSTAEREMGLDAFTAATTDDGRETNDTAYQRGATMRRNIHPTVKSVALMRWLMRLITPPGGLVLDLFTGSGTTGIAAMCEGVRFVGVEQSEEFARIARARIAFAAANPRAFDKKRPKQRSK